MNKKRIFTYRFVFKWDDGTEDETEFCASNIDEAMELFVNWCHDDMQIPYTPAVQPCVVYDADDAVEYGEQYFANPCPGHVYKDLVCIIGKVYAEEFPDDPSTLPFGPAECGFYIDGQAEWFN